jgi:hypothetical protein
MLRIYFIVFALAVNLTETKKLLTKETSTQLHRDKLLLPLRR